MEGLKVDDSESETITKVKVKPEEDEKALVEGLKVDVAVVLGVGVQDYVSENLKYDDDDVVNDQKVFLMMEMDMLMMVTCIPMIA